MTRRGRQLPLILPHPPALGEGDFLLGEANREAFAIVTGWPEWPAPVVWLHGPAGSGKTHLVEIWREIGGGSVVAGAELTASLAEARLEAGEAIAVEGIERADERALFHLLNLARERGGSLLLTSRPGPDALAPRLPDLSSRLRAAYPVGLSAPDDELLGRVLVKLFADRQIRVEPAVATYVLNRMERSFAAAARLVARIDAAALAEGRAVTRQLAADILEEEGPND